MDFVPDRQFDAVVSGMMMHLVEDFGKVAQSAHRTLDAGGSFLFSQRHPLRTSNPCGDNKSLNSPSWAVSDYFRTGRRDYEWLDTSVMCFHRSIEEILGTLLNLGFSVVEVAEPQPAMPLASRRISENLSSPSVLLVHVRK